MKFRPALLLCPLLYLGFTSIELNGQGIHIIPVAGTPAPSTYQGRAGKYSVFATFQTNGTISALVYDRSIIVPTDERITGVGPNAANGFVYISFGESGYLEGRVHRRGTRIIARLVLQAADKITKRRCVLKRYAWPSGGHGVGTTYVPTPPLPRTPIATPPPAETTNAA